MNATTLEKPLAAVTLTEEQVVKLRKIWIGYGEGPYYVDDWLIYLPRLRAENRHFPDVEKVDILSQQMNSYVYFLVCKALENNDQTELDNAFKFLDELTVQQIKHKAIVKFSSFEKLKVLRAGVPK